MFTKKNFSKKRRKFEFMVSEAQSISKYLQLESIWKVTLKEKLLIRVAAAAKSLQSCPTLCDPIDGSPPGSPSLGFSRQEHWSGLPFPSPVHEREKRRGSRSIMSDSSQPHGLQPTRLLRPWDFPGKSTGGGVPLSLWYVFSWICVS